MRITIREGETLLGRLGDRLEGVIGRAQLRRAEPSAQASPGRNGATVLCPGGATEISRWQAKRSHRLAMPSDNFSRPAGRRRTS